MSFIWHVCLNCEVDNKSLSVTVSDYAQSIKILIWKPLLFQVRFLSNVKNLRAFRH